MKKLFFLIVFFSLIFSGCSTGISQEKYDKVVAERDALIIENDNLKAEYSESLKQLESVEQELESVKSLLNEYDTIIQRYKDLAEIESSTAVKNEEGKTITADNQTDSSINAEKEIQIVTSATGTKYHYSNCRTLKKAGNVTTVDAAKAAGYGPCAVCNPPK